MLGITFTDIVAGDSSTTFYATIERAADAPLQLESVARIVIVADRPELKRLINFTPKPNGFETQSLWFDADNDQLLVEYVHASNSSIRVQATPLVDRTPGQTTTTGQFVAALTSLATNPTDSTFYVASGNTLTRLTPGSTAEDAISEDDARTTGTTAQADYVQTVIATNVLGEKDRLYALSMRFGQLIGYDRDPATGGLPLRTNK